MFLCGHPNPPTAYNTSAWTEVFALKLHDNFNMDGLSMTANLLGDPGRAAMLLRLMGGIALPAGELARAANIAPQTASGHLGRMVKGHLLTMERQGRHRYYRLASDQVGDAIEALLRLTIRMPDIKGSAASRKLATGTLAHARTCYSHLAGWLGVAIAEAMERQGILSTADAKTYAITTAGRVWFESTLSIQVPSSPNPQRNIASRCLDWTERRHHLSGVIGCAMYRRFLELSWLAPVRGARAVRVTIEGKKQFWDLLRLPLG
jgi:DNA-binding transcriptional ArsR family regulator